MSELVAKKMKTKVVVSAMFLASCTFLLPVQFASAASSITLTSNSPQTCQLAGVEVTVSGSATADAPPGQLQQYAAYVDWGDGNLQTVLAPGSFGSGHGVSQKPYGPVSHVYTTPGTYQITAKIYHTNPNGNDNPDATSAPFSVCIVAPLSISKTVVTSYDRSWDWSVEKTADETSLVLADGQVSPVVNYTVSANASSVDSNFLVAGQISVTNPLGNPTLSVQGVTDVMSVDNTGATVVCPGGFPQNLLPGGSLVCTYSQTTNAAMNQTNTASVDVDVDVLDSSSSPVDVSFGAPATISDECATFSDTNAAGPQAVQICAGIDALPVVWNYGVTFGKHADADIQLVCGVNPTYINTISFVTNDTASMGDDSWSLDAEVMCVGSVGCTLTQGYWKTHSERGPAPYDDTWAFLASGADTLLFASGQTWYQTFWTPPKNGNVWYQLAHQYMAARLNQLNGADVPANVSTALSGSATWLNTYSPAAKLKGKDATNAAVWASTLGSYNEGSIGPGHCSEI